MNWSEVIKEIESKSGKIIDLKTNWNNDNPEYARIYQLLKDSEVSFDTAQWINYYPGQDFRQSVVDEIATELKVKPCRAWISRVNPGYYVPYHWDVDDNLEEYEKAGALRRFTCFINKPELGQIILIDTQYLHSQPQGTMYEWTNYKAWHASTNASLKPKYLFHLLGY
jgi:hypothetical protein